MASGLHDRLWGSAGITGETPDPVWPPQCSESDILPGLLRRSVTQKRVASLQRYQLCEHVEAQTEWRGRELNWGALGSRPTRGSTVWSPCAVMSLRGGKLLQTGSVDDASSCVLPELPVRIQFSLIQSYRVNCNQTIRMERKKVIDNHLPWCCFVGITHTHTRVYMYNNFYSLSRNDKSPSFTSWEGKSQKLRNRPFVMSQQKQPFFAQSESQIISFFHWGKKKIKLFFLGGGLKYLTAGGSTESGQRNKDWILRVDVGPLKHDDSPMPHVYS